MRNLCTVFHSGYTNSAQVISFLHILTTLISFLLTIAILIRLSWCLIVALIGDVEYLLATCVFWKMLFTSSAHFLIGLFGVVFAVKFSDFFIYFDSLFFIFCIYCRFLFCGYHGVYIKHLRDSVAYFMLIRT